MVKNYSSSTEQAAELATKSLPVLLLSVLDVSGTLFSTISGIFGMLADTVGKVSDKPKSLFVTASVYPIWSF